MQNLKFTVETLHGQETIDADVSTLIIAGWAGRDKEAMEHHIRELEALGVARPASTPTYYRVAAARLTQEAEVEDAGPHSSGEVETFLLSSGGVLYVGVGSDHTDRQVETVGVTISKQICDKPVATSVWCYEDVAAHWDNLILRSHAVIDGQKVLYQEGAVSGLLAPDILIRGYEGRDNLPDGTAMFGGTMPAIGGIRMASRFEAELVDPVLDRRIQFAYDVKVLPIRG
jgi:Protein of unknown function (DUF2848)